MSSEIKYKISNIPVVYEDDWLMVIDKPAGLITIPSPKKETRTLTSILNEELKQQGLSYRLHPCHRLDRDTSGLIIYAKGKSSQKKMMQEFKFHRVRKFYLAFAHGRVSENSGEIKQAIEERQALTRFRTLERRKGFSIMEVMPLTGRKNQIRLHFRSIGHPLVGETRFVFRRHYSLRFKRICLHAQRLEFAHPVTRKTISVEARIPEDMEQFLKKN